MSQIVEKAKYDQSKAWVWVLGQMKLEKIQKKEALNEPRAAQSALERKAAEALQVIAEEQAWKLKDKFKGNTLAAYYKGSGKLTPQGWKTAISILWPGYEDKIGKKPLA